MRKAQKDQQQQQSYQQIYLYTPRYSKLRIATEMKTNITCIYSYTCRRELRIVVQNPLLISD